MGVNVSRIPTLAEYDGAKTTCPLGRSVEPLNFTNELDPMVVLLENERAEGLNMPTFAAIPGVNITFPDGRRTPPLNEPYKFPVGLIAVLDAV